MFLFESSALDLVNVLLGNGALKGEDNVNVDPSPPYIHLLFS